MTLAMANGVIKGQFILGQNPMVGAVNTELVERGLAKLEWLVVRDFAMTETANFWQKGRRCSSGELTPDADRHRGVLPARRACRARRTARSPTPAAWCSGTTWCCEAPGDSRSDLWFIYHLGKRLKALYADSTRAARPRRSRR